MTAAERGLFYGNRPDGQAHHLVAGFHLANDAAILRIQQSAYFDTGGQENPWGAIANNLHNGSQDETSHKTCIKGATAAAPADAGQPSITSKKKRG